ncbi:MAG: hypothetical protein ACOC4I_06230, partial [Spirochaetota bacterium]
GFVYVVPEGVIERARENVRKRVLNEILTNPEYVDPEAVQLGEIPGIPEADAKSLVLDVIRDYAAERAAEVEEKRPASGAQPAAYVYRFKDVAREQQDVTTLRSSRKLADHDIGSVVFDSGSS